MNDAYGITRENLLAALPDVLRGDGPLLALGSAVSDVLAARAGEIDRAKVYAGIDGLPEGLLDILAYDFKVDWWDPEYSVEVKRQVLKDSWDVHRALGTKSAVERAISAVYRDTKVREWFEYGGPPFHFKLEIDATYEHADPAKHRRVLDRLEYYKNLRSSPYAVEYVARPKGGCEAYAAIAAYGMYMEMTVEVPVYGLE